TCGSRSPSRPPWRPCWPSRATQRAHPGSTAAAPRRPSDSVDPLDRSRSIDALRRGMRHARRPARSCPGSPSRGGAMESIYYVMAWACHRRCKHCYEERFRPYTGAELGSVVAEAVANFPRIIDHLPERMTYLDLEHPEPDGRLPERVGRIIVSGGESLV